MKYLPILLLLAGCATTPIKCDTVPDESPEKALTPNVTCSAFKVVYLNDAKPEAFDDSVIANGTKYCKTHYVKSPCLGHVYKYATLRYGVSCKAVGVP